MVKPQQQQQVWKQIVLPVATALIAWGAFPKPPAFVQKLATNELFQYFMIFVLVWQGGGRQDVATSLMVTVGMFLLTKILNLRTLVGDLEQQRMMPAPLPAPPAVVVSTNEGFRNSKRRH